ncbi:MAG: hypothetical protein ACOYXC_21770 [Candidatus Rifleibacteriota bacterium]
MFEKAKAAFFSLQEKHIEYQLNQGKTRLRPAEKFPRHNGFRGLSGNNLQHHYLTGVKLFPMHEYLSPARTQTMKNSAKFLQVLGKIEDRSEESACERS